MCHDLESSRSSPETKNEFKSFIQATKEWGYGDKKEESQYLSVMSRLPRKGEWSSDPSQTSGGLCETQLRVLSLPKAGQLRDFIHPLLSVVG